MLLPNGKGLINIHFQTQPALLQRKGRQQNICAMLFNLKSNKSNNVNQSINQFANQQITESKLKEVKGGIVISDLLVE